MTNSVRVTLLARAAKAKSTLAPIISLFVACKTQDAAPYD